ncbi:Rrf2 family transcriptional regulator [Candidatus Saganbacteria bacterium]|nr:Rrf2 family transcriptional regulator [Candidatus Saganbacteria bacterium]
MKITRASDYAIRLLMHLAQEKDGEGRSEKIAKELGIPFNHLAKLVQILGRKGYLITRKGKGGGLKLALDPRKVNLAEVIEAIEGPLVISDCIGKNKFCIRSSKCKIRKCFKTVRDKILELLQETSIHDMIG